MFTPRHLDANDQILNTVHDALRSQCEHRLTNPQLRNYLRNGINITTNQKLSLSRETGTLLTTAIHKRLSPQFFFREEGRLYIG